MASVSPSLIERARRAKRAEEVERIKERKWKRQMLREESGVLRPPTREERLRGCLSQLTGGHRGLSGIQQDFKQEKRVVNKNDVRVYLRNMPKNRYKDVPCLDKTRVILEDCDNDYIHANYMQPTKKYIDKDDQKLTRFICCQAPIKETLIDHWRMIVQEEVEVILMLCDYKVDGKEKCAEYIPTTEKPEMTFGPFTIKLKNSDKVKWECETAAIVNISTLEVHKEGKMLREVFHYHWVGLPDSGLPPADGAFVEFMAQIKAFSATRSPMRRKPQWADQRRPILVHDSAGTGWAAVFVLAEMVLERIRKGMGSCLDSLLNDVRNHRANAIETEAQYLFLHKILIDHLAEITHAQGGSDVAQFNYEFNEFLKTLSGEKKIPEDWR